MILNGQLKFSHVKICMQKKNLNRVESIFFAICLDLLSNMKYHDFAET